MLILPGDPEFDSTLALNLPFGWQLTANTYGGDYGFVVDADSGLLRVENSIGIREYVEGGEYNARLAQIESDDEVEDEDDAYEEFIWSE